MKELDYTKLSNPELLAHAKDAAVEIRKSLRKDLRMSDFTLESKSPWKAALFREMLVHRFNDLVDVSLELYESGRIIPPFIVTRAAMENTAMMYWLSIELAKFSQSRDEGALDDFLMKGMFGGRDPESPRQAYNVLTAIDHLDKLYKGTRSVYDRLCEFTHPNYFGVMGSYADIDYQEHVTRLGKEHSNELLEFGLVPLVVSIEIFMEYYNSAGHMLETINASYENKGKQESQ